MNRRYFITTILGTLLVPFLLVLPKHKPKLYISPDVRKWGGCDINENVRKDFYYNLKIDKYWYVSWVEC